jgi:hypothetical protein
VGYEWNEMEREAGLEILSFAERDSANADWSIASSYG